MSGTCRTHTEKVYSENLKGRHDFGDVGIERKIKLTVMK
jgi:hypothetical protein